MSANTLAFYTVGMSFVPRLVIAWGINLAALWAADALWDGVKINGWTSFLLGSAVLGIANAVLKKYFEKKSRPPGQLLTIPKSS